MNSLHYVAYKTEALTIAARLRVPQDGREKHPAVILLHGSAGPSLREGGYADVLNEAGFVTLEPDMWAARGFKGGTEGRPRPWMRWPIFTARAPCSRRIAAVDRGADRRGGILVRRRGLHVGGDAAAQCRVAGRRFRALMPVYPATWAYNQVPGFEFGDLADTPHAADHRGARPVRQRSGSLALSWSPASKPADAAKIRTLVMPDSHHGFDMPGIDVEVSDPFGNQGKGGKVIMRYNRQRPGKAHRAAVAFFAAALK